VSVEETVSFFDSDVSHDELAIRKAAFKAILDGEPITPDGLLGSTGFAPEKTHALLEGLAKRGLIVIESDSGRIVGSWGLSFVPTDHRLRIRKRTLYTWCAEDAVGIPAALAEDASILSRCHECGVSVNIEMAAGRVAQVVPSDIRLWVADIEVGRSVVGHT
jgi:alkylmercury lyase